MRSQALRSSQALRAAGCEHERRERRGRACVRRGVGAIGRALPQPGQRGLVRRRVLRRLRGRGGSLGGEQRLSADAARRTRPLLRRAREAAHPRRAQGEAAHDPGQVEHDHNVCPDMGGPKA